MGKKKSRSFSSLSESQQDKRVLSHLQNQSGEASLRQIQRAMGATRYNSREPLKNPVNRSLARLRDAGKISVNESASGFGEPTFGASGGGASLGGGAFG